MCRSDSSLPPTQKKIRRNVGCVYVMNSTSRFLPRTFIFRLVEEVYEIGDTLEQLRAKMVEVEKALQQLHQTRQTLEYDLSVKNNSIHVDRELCLSWRKSFDMSPRRSVYY